jgi:hypothetical protein
MNQIEDNKNSYFIQLNQYLSETLQTNVGTVNRFKGATEECEPSPK